jgi:hypothetical protein
MARHWGPCRVPVSFLITPVAKMLPLRSLLHCIPRNYRCRIVYRVPFHVRSLLAAPIFSPLSPHKRRAAITCLRLRRPSYLHKDPVYGCQIGTTCPILHAEYQLCPHAATLQVPALLSPLHRTRCGAISSSKELLNKHRLSVLAVRAPVSMLCWQGVWLSGRQCPIFLKRPLARGEISRRKGDSGYLRFWGFGAKTLRPFAGPFPTVSWVFEIEIPETCFLFPIPAVSTFLL